MSVLDFIILSFQTIVCQSYQFLSCSGIAIFALRVSIAFIWGLTYGYTCTVYLPSSIFSIYFLQNNMVVVVVVVY